jgi:hypothetical protein
MKTAVQGMNEQKWNGASFKEGKKIKRAVYYIKAIIRSLTLYHFIPD